MTSPQHPHRSTAQRLSPQPSQHASQHASQHPSQHPSQHRTRAGGTITISCDTCVMRATVACEDCMVTALLGADEHEAVVLDLAEQRAVRLLVDAGLVPALRHREAI